MQANKYSIMASSLGLSFLSFINVHFEGMLMWGERRGSSNMAAEQNIARVFGMRNSINEKGDEHH